MLPRWFGWSYSNRPVLVSLKRATAPPGRAYCPGARSALESDAGRLIDGKEELRGITSLDLAVQSIVGHRDTVEAGGLAFGVPSVRVRAVIEDVAIGIVARTKPAMLVIRLVAVENPTFRLAEPTVFV
jgi:hypothetical protein